MPNCTFCQSPAFKAGAFLVAIVLILWAWKYGIEGLIE